jgi:two-component system LytT family response regulator
MKVLLVDDEAAARARLRRLLTAHPDVQLLGEAADAEAALDCIDAQRPDVVFLDIDMPGEDGLALALRLPPEVLCVFSTAHAQYALRAFDLQAVDYLLKPCGPERLARALARLRQQIRTRAQTQAQSLTPLPQPPQAAAPGSVLRALQQVQPTPGHWWVERQGQRLRLPLADLEWVQAADNYIELHAPPQHYLERRSLADFLAHPEIQGRFVRIHRSHAVQLACIVGLQPLAGGDSLVLLRSGQELRMSRRHRQACGEGERG